MTKKKISHIISLLLVFIFEAFFSVGDIGALPPLRPGLVDPLTKRYRTTGAPVPIVPERIRNYRRPNPLGGKYPYSNPAVTSIRPRTAPRAVNTLLQAAVRPLVILVDFDDYPAAVDNASVENLFFGSGSSIRTYWAENSYGAFAVERPSAAGLGNPDVVGWLRAGDISPVNSYAQISGINNDNNLRILLDNVVSHVFGSAGLGLDRTPYVSVDNNFMAVILVHPGMGQEDTGDPADPFSHTTPLASGGPAPIVSGPYTIRDFTIVPSLQRTGALLGPGVVVHEMGHLLGLPDLYQTPDQVYSGVGVFDLMGYGLWGDPSRGDAENPSHLSAWSKTELGWMHPRILSWWNSPSGPSSFTLRPAEVSDNCYKVYPNGPGDESQYFLVENRRNDPFAVSFPAVFDKGLPGSGGILVWRVDNEKMDAWRTANGTPLLRPNTVNNDNAFLALAVQEADLTDADFVPHLTRPIPGVIPPGGAAELGSAGDFFDAGKTFTRTTPVNRPNGTNSAPTVSAASGAHRFDVGFLLEIVDFVRSVLDHVFRFFVDLPFWNAYQDAGTPLRPIRRVKTYAFDGSNRTWIGTPDQGVWIRRIGSWKQIGGLTTQNVSSMAFERRVSGMWVGTDNTLFKVRNDQILHRLPDDLGGGTGFSRIVPGQIVIDRDSKKWVGGTLLGTTKGGLMAVYDTGLNVLSDIQGHFTGDLVQTNFVDRINGRTGFVAGETITSMALDNVSVGNLGGDVLYVGTSQGNVYRNADMDNGAVVYSLYTANFFNTVRFEPIDMRGFVTSPNVRPGYIHAMSVDATGILWIATDRGVFAFQRGDSEALGAAATPGIDHFDPFDLDGNNLTRSLVYFPRMELSPALSSSDRPLGIGFEETGQLHNVAWIAWGDNNAATISGTGGAERLDPNIFGNAMIRKDAVPGLASPGNRERIGHARMFFRTVSGAPERGPVVNDLIGAFGDGSTNIWFATKNSGAVRFGTGTILQLDKDLYINEGAIATVELADENATTPTLTVRVYSTVDPFPGGFDLPLTRQSDNVYRGSFGFTKGVTDDTLDRIGVATKSIVTVRYTDSRRLAPREANAEWRDVFPFDDSLLVGGLACFVATAAYGSPMAAEVDDLRAFRDLFLLPHAPGRALVAAYYASSPPAAAFIARHEGLRAGARFLLAPVVGISRFAVAGSCADKAAAAGILLAGILVLAGPLRRKRLGANRHDRRK